MEETGDSMVIACCSGRHFAENGGSTAMSCSTGFNGRDGGNKSFKKRQKETEIPIQKTYALLILLLVLLLLVLRDDRQPLICAPFG